MFFSKGIDWKREVAVNLLGNGGYGREKFLKERYHLSRSEFWDVRQRILEALEPLPSGRPRHLLAEDSTGPCAACQEKTAQIATILANHAAERERGSRRLTIQAAVLPNSAESIVLLQKAAFGDSPSAETIRTRIVAASERAAAVMDSIPWAKVIRQLGAEMPGVAWDLLPMSMYRAHNWHCFEHLQERQPYASMHTSLGCPYKCTFCCINAPFGKPSYRLWSPDAVIAEIGVLVERYGVRNIKFVDEMFVLNEGHVLGICDRIIERGYDLNIWAYARVDTVRDEFLDKLRRAGFRWLALGIESGSKHVRDGVEKGRFGSLEILAVVRKIQAAGINVIGNYIFGLPDDTHETMQETLDLAIEANCEFANFYCAMAYPGSKLYTMAVERGWELPASWIGFSQHSYETLTSAEVLGFRDQAFTRYFTNPSYLDLVRRKFGEEVRAHVTDMTKIHLRRKLLESTVNA